MSHHKMTKEEEEERDHFKKVVGAFNNYKRDSKDRLAKAHLNLKNIPLEHQKILVKHSHLANLQQLDSCVELNSNIIADITADAESMFENQASCQFSTVLPDSASCGHLGHFPNDLGTNAMWI